MSLSLKFSLKKLTLKAFWSKVTLSQTLLLDNDLNCFIPLSSIDVSLFSEVADNLTLEFSVYVTPLKLFVSCFNGYKLRLLNELFKTKTLLLLLVSKYV